MGCKRPGFAANWSTYLLSIVIKSSSYPSEYYSKGMRMAGRGRRHVKVQNLRVLKVVMIRTYFVIKGCSWS
jgi:hypothetical protein